MEYMLNQMWIKVLRLFFLLLLISISQTSSCCHGDVRLVNGYTPNEGRVEVCLSSQWHTICGDNWDTTDAGVVCVQLGFMRQNAQALTYYGSFGNGSGAILDYVSCSGTETELTDCTLIQDYYYYYYYYCYPFCYCTHANDAGIRCAAACQTGDIRLQDGSQYGQGRVEVCKNGAWGTVCDDHWNFQDAEVVCRQLGFSSLNAQAHSSSIHGRGNGSIHIDDVMCNGNESSLFDCPHSIRHNCGHHEDASVTCQANGIEKVRLTGGPSQYEGAVEIFLNGRWQHVCFDGWNESDAIVVCMQLGASSPSRVYGVDLVNDQPKNEMVLRNVNCNGTESQLTSCCATETQWLYCSSQRYAGVKCGQCVEGGLRLVNGPSQYEGRLEICLEGRWGTICDDRFSRNEAIVACRQLGFLTEGAYSQHGAPYGQGTTLPILMNDVECTSTENKLTQCSYLNGQQHNCQHTEDVGVVCQKSPGMPQCLNIVTESPLEVTLRWTGPLYSERYAILGYTIMCSSIKFGNSIAHALNTSNKTYEGTLSQLQPFDFYNCCVSASNHEGIGQPICELAITEQTAPTGAPIGVQGYSQSSSTIFLSWSPPLIEHQNGIIQHYHINITNTVTNNQETIITGATNFVFKDLEPNLTYTFTVAAYTIAMGPSSEPIQVSTEPKMNTISTCESNQLSNSISGTPIMIALGSLAGLSAALATVLGIVSGTLACCFYCKVKKNKNSNLVHTCEEHGGITDDNGNHKGNQYTHKETSWQLKSKSDTCCLQSAELESDCVYLNASINPNSVELDKDKHSGPLEAPIYQPLQTRSEDGASGVYQSLTQSVAEYDIPRPLAMPLKKTQVEYQNLPHKSKQRSRKKGREVYLEKVVIKKRKT